MAQRNSGYERKERDLYETPEWVTLALKLNLPTRPLTIWEPACASGKIARVVEAARATDLVTSYGTAGVDFLQQSSMDGCDAIITNPPFNKGAEAFIRHGLSLLLDAAPDTGFMAMLLPVDFDSALTRRDIFNDCPWFDAKVVLTSRIVWVERTDGKKAAPSANHAWFVWDMARDAQYPPNIRYHFRCSKNSATSPAQPSLGLSSS